MKIGYLITSYNDSEEAINAYKSIVKNIPAGTTFKVVVVDAGSNSEHIKNLQQNIGEVLTPYPCLSDAYNVGLYRLLGYFPDNIKNFVSTGVTDVSHICWIHPDMVCFQPDYGQKLAKIYDYLSPLVGRLAAGTSNIDCSINELQNNKVLREGNAQSWMMGTEFLRQHIAKYGYVYNNEYIGIGSCEDIDMWMRMHEDGYLVAICSLVDIVHFGMMTRKKRDTNSEQYHNRGVYHKYWGYNGTNHNQLGPCCSFDFTELNKELLEKFGYLKEEVLSLIPERDKAVKDYEKKFGK